MKTKTILLASLLVLVLFIGACASVSQNYSSGQQAPSSTTPTVSNTGDNNVDSAVNDVQSNPDLGTTPDVAVSNESV